MPESSIVSISSLPVWGKQTVTVGDTKILLIRGEDTSAGPQVFAMEAECPHAKAPLEEGAICRGMLVCPWHGGTFEIASGALLEPPPLRALKRYPVRVDGDAISVDGTPIVPRKAEPVGSDAHFVFAGAGAATTAAICLLRERGFAGKLTLIDPHAEEPIDRTVLTKMALSGEMPLDEAEMLPAKEMAALQLQRVRAEVKAVDSEARTVTLNTGEAVRYDALLLATGGRPKRLHVPGAQQEHVFTIRHRGDLERIDALLKSGAKAVIVGDSFIALEAASALTQRKLKVTVVGRGRMPFAKQFGEEIAGAMLQLHRDHGVTLLTDEECVKITSDSVLLKSGMQVAADVVLFAVGIEPVTDFAPGLPHAGEKGFKVSRDLRVAQHVYAAGDIASVDGLRIEHWRVAEQHGRVAAAAMLAVATGGASEPYEGVPYFWTYHFGKRFNYVGHATQWDFIEIIGELAAFKFLAFYVKDGKVIAVLGCGMETAFAALVSPMCSPLTLEEAKREVAAVG